MYFNYREWNTRRTCQRQQILFNRILILRRILLFPVIFYFLIGFNIEKYLTSKTTLIFTLISYRLNMHKLTLKIKNKIIYRRDVRETTTRTENDYRILMLSHMYPYIVLFYKTVITRGRNYILYIFFYNCMQSDRITNHKMCKLITKVFFCIFENISR